MQQNKPIFSNKTMMNEALAREYLALTWNHHGGVARYVMYAVSLLALGTGVYRIVQYGAPAASRALGMFGLAICAFALAQWGYLLKSNAYIKSQKVLWAGDSLEKNVDFFEARITQISPLGQLTVTYDQVTEYFEGPALIVIMVGEAAIVISKAGFTKGTISGFRDFILTKCRLKSKKNI